MRLFSSSYTGNYHCDVVIVEGVAIGALYVNDIHARTVKASINQETKSFKVAYEGKLIPFYLNRKPTTYAARKRYESYH